MSNFEQSILDAINLVQSDNDPELVAVFPKGYLPEEVEQEFLTKKFHRGVKVIITDNNFAPAILDVGSAFKWKIF